MPIYEYQCLHCHNEFEMLVRSSGPAPACPQCNGTDLHKKLSAFAAHTASASGASDVDAPCGTCGAPGGPGSCRFQPA
jgi:putative FmdB family regulatory protein